MFPPKTNIQQLQRLSNCISKEHHVNCRSYKKKFSKKWREEKVG